MSKQLEGKTVFASLLTKRPRYYSDPGSREADVYELTIDKKGHKKLELTGTKDIYEEIQSYADECDIHQIIARAAAGDIEVLNRSKGIYADITEAPQTLAEAQKIIIKLGNEFDKLPNEIKEKFDYSKEVFVNNYGSNEWFDAMGFEKENAQVSEQKTFDGMKAPEVLTPEVNENE